MIKTRDDVYSPEVVLYDGNKDENFFFDEPTNQVSANQVSANHDLGNYFHESKNFLIITENHFQAIASGRGICEIDRV